MAEHDKEADLRQLKINAARGAATLGGIKGIEYGSRKVKEAKIAEADYHTSEAAKKGLQSVGPDAGRHAEAAEKAFTTAEKAAHTEALMHSGFKFAALGAGAGLGVESAAYYIRHRNGKTEKVHRPRSTSGMRNFNRLPVNKNSLLGRHMNNG